MRFRPIHNSVTAIQYTGDAGAVTEFLAGTGYRCTNHSWATGEENTFIRISPADDRPTAHHDASHTDWIILDDDKILVLDDDDFRSHYVPEPGEV